jgi:hypothetical protein
MWSISPSKFARLLVDGLKRAYEAGEIDIDDSELEDPEALLERIMLVIPHEDLVHLAPELAADMAYGIGLAEGKQLPQSIYHGKHVCASIVISGNRSAGRPRGSATGGGVERTYKEAALIRSLRSAGCTWSEISRQLGISEKAARSRLKQCSENLQKLDLRSDNCPDTETQPPPIFAFLSSDPDCASRFFSSLDF